jgi:hypothetical protein
VTGGAHDTLRDELAEALWRHWADADNEHDADWSIVPDDEKHTWRGYAEVAVRFADAQVAAERARIAADTESAIGWAFVGVLVETVEGELTVKSAKELAAIAARIARGQP